MLTRKIRQELAKHDRPENKIDAQQFHKERLKNRFVFKAPVLRKISNEIYKENVKGRSKQEILSICDDLLATRRGPERFMAIEWAAKLKKQYAKTDFVRFESWLKKYVNNWGACDHLCGSVIGVLLQRLARQRCQPPPKRFSG